ncbi:hypothetical protein CPB83DRAFT_897310 [Crepidotus variabilis]|uniref:Uncharacterized protein n=1 Tax=Crepidotus variabilis TaxID=179855 RepID=A0A9P6E9V0_9AGAR|nr:hypothetical protein CPB83DRAFT_897310 [Crepidotus variabilis]
MPLHDTPLQSDWEITAEQRNGVGGTIDFDPQTSTNEGVLTRWVPAGVSNLGFDVPIGAAAENNIRQEDDPFMVTPANYVGLAEESRREDTSTFNPQGQLPVKQIRTTRPAARPMPTSTLSVAERVTELLGEDYRLGGARARVNAFSGPQAVSSSPSRSIASVMPRQARARADHGLLNAPQLVNPPVSSLSEHIAGIQTPSSVETQLVPAPADNDSNGDEERLTSGVPVVHSTHNELQPPTGHIEPQRNEEQVSRDVLDQQSPARKRRKGSNGASLTAVQGTSSAAPQHTADARAHAEALIYGAQGKRIKKPKLRDS